MTAAPVDGPTPDLVTIANEIADRLDAQSDDWITEANQLRNIAAAITAARTEAERAVQNMSMVDRAIRALAQEADE
jgi:hypothetical protein